MLKLNAFLKKQDVRFSLKRKIKSKILSRFTELINKSIEDIFILLLVYKTGVSSN